MGLFNTEIHPETPLKTPAPYQKPKIYELQNHFVPTHTIGNWTIDPSRPLCLPTYCKHSCLHPSPS